MKSQIIGKLKKELEKDFTSEPQIVYIFTRIGKILEVDNKKNRYPVLYFYRNWIVHSEINDTARIKSDLEIFIRDATKRYKFLFHESLRAQLKNFLVEYDLPVFNRDKLGALLYLLGKVISDTPISIDLGGKKYKFEIGDPPKIWFSGVYRITEL
jgi:hypothetical protein